MKEFIKKNKAVISITVVLVLFILIAFLLEKNGKATLGDGLRENVSQWLEDTKSEDYVLTVIASTECGWCKEYKPEMNKIKKDYPDLKIYWFEVDKLTESEVKTVLTTYKSEFEGGTPHTFLTYKGKVKDIIRGYKEKDKVKEILKKNNVISE